MNCKKTPKQIQYIYLFIIYQKVQQLKVCSICLKNLFTSNNCFFIIIWTFLISSNFLEKKGKFIFFREQMCCSSSEFRFYVDAWWWLWLLPRQQHIVQIILKSSKKDLYLLWNVLNLLTIVQYNVIICIFNSVINLSYKM